MTRGHVRLHVPLSPDEAGDVAGIELYWLPLGADGNPVVRWSGRLYEAVVARHQHRPRRALYHSALVVHGDDATYAIEMAPVWVTKAPDRGVVGEGAVGLPWLGRFRAFRYEIRRWLDGVVPDLASAVGGPVRLDATEQQVRRLLELVPACPTPTWGLDELGTGDMWNSNSLIAWLLVRSGLSTDELAPPARGRAPGWNAGIAVAWGRNAGPALATADLIRPARRR
jgi:hypothetical protein